MAEETNVEERAMKRNFHFGKGVYHPGARPFKIVVDASGQPWLCDRKVDESKDLASQGCWRCRDLTFTSSE